MPAVKETVNATFEVEIPSGWEFLRFGVPKAGECYLSNRGGGVLKCEVGWAVPRNRPLTRHRVILKRHRSLDQIEQVASKGIEEAYCPRDLERFEKIVQLVKALKQ